METAKTPVDISDRMIGDTKEGSKHKHTKFQKHSYCLLPQATLTSMVLGFLGSGGGSFSTVTVSTPSLHTAATLSTSALSGSTNLRMNLPIRRSMRRYLASSSRSSRRRSPLTTSTRSSSTCTRMSPVPSPGMSTTNAYAPGSSFTSAGVAAMARASRT
uniref:Uncharacterized protein n=1 Tax=Zea mays TaxID=4577 RepID=A0A804QLC1_MAIZE